MREFEVTLKFDVERCYAVKAKDAEAALAEARRLDSTYGNSPESEDWHECEEDALVEEFDA